MKKPLIEINRQGPHIVRAFLILGAVCVAIIIGAVEFGAFRGLVPGDIGFYPPPAASPAH